MSFMKSVIRGAGSELGRSAMRAAVINPLFKGSDARSVSVNNQGFDASKVSVLEADVIQVGTKNNSGLNWFLAFFVGFSWALVIPAFGFIVSKSIKEPRKIMKLDQSYYKADGRTKSGFRVNENASIVDINVIDVDANQKMLASIYKVLGFINIAVLLFCLSIMVAKVAGLIH
jgi:hypothetical protein